MANRPKVEFMVNIPLALKLGDNFKNGQGQYGPWFGWGVHEGAVEKTLFADQELNEKIKGYPKGTDVQITKQQIGPKQFAWFVMPSGIQPPPGIAPQAPPVVQNGHPSPLVREARDREGYRGERVLRAEEANIDSMKALKTDQVDENVRALAISFLIDEQRQGISAPDDTANF